MSSSNPPQWTPDVYVSFIASDEGKNFLSALFKQLERAGIGYFRKGNERDDYFQEAIRQARFAIVVFSANYAKCSHRLNELVNILLRREHSLYPSLVVIPIFHGIKPAEALKLQIEGDVREALNQLRGDARDAKENEWRRALAKAEGIPCYNLKTDAVNDVSELTKKIVEHLVSKIRSLYSFKVFGPFGCSGDIPWHFHAKNVTHDEYQNFINSVYSEVNGGDLDKAKLHGGEHVISFSGYFQEARDGRRIQGLTFLTTKDRPLSLLPTGQGGREDFSVQLPVSAGKVIEFFGSKSQGGFVTSIGARVELTRGEQSPEVSHPPWFLGSKDGEYWNYDYRPTTVIGIRAVRDSSGNGCIRSIAFQNDDGKWWPRGSDQERHMEFKIHGSDEYLSSISGYHTNDGITSLTFLTNKKSTITIGDGKGTHFSSPATGYKIVGFYGWSDQHLLHGIGAYYKPMSDLHPIKSIGPFGGGNAWDDGKFKGVKKFYIFKDDNIRYIKIVYENGSEDGHTVIHGDYTEGLSDKEDMVDLDTPGEHLTSISGYTRNYGSIQSLTFHSNRKTKTLGYSEGGEYFGYPSHKSRIIGFYGTCGKTLKSIGVYEEPILNWNTSNCTPFEGSGGHRWEDGVHSNVVGFRVTHVGEGGNLKIRSITFMYENNGSLVEGSRHGGGDPSEGSWKMLNFPEERLDRIEGYYLSESGQTIIHNLKIFTTDLSRTVHTYANRGDPKSFNKKFKIPDETKEGRRIVGFFGTAGKDHLNSIGACLEP